MGKASNISTHIYPRVTAERHCFVWVKKCFTFRDSEERFTLLLSSVPELSPDDFDGSSFPWLISAIDVRLVRIISMIIPLQSRQMFICGPFSRFLLGSIAGPGFAVNVLARCSVFGFTVFVSSFACCLRCEVGEWGTDPVLKKKRKKIWTAHVLYDTVEQLSTKGNYFILSREKLCICQLLYLVLFRHPCNIWR